MKKKKVFLISFNKLTTDFWKQHLDFENAQLWHWNTPVNGMNNLTSIWPDVVIIDGYFSNGAYLASLREMLNLKSKQKIFCLTPLPKAHDKIIYADERLTISKLDKEVITEINCEINPLRPINLIKKIA
jgi:hypothetical protein